MKTDELKRLGARLRAERLERGLTLAEVARAVDVSQAFLSHIENGKGDITFTRLRRLIVLYGLTLSDLMGPHSADTRVVRAAELEPLPVGDEVGLEAFLLAPRGPHMMMPIMSVYEPGGHTVEPFRLESEEFIHVLKGRIEITFEDGETLSMSSGDSVYLREPHRTRLYRNAGRGQAVTVSVISPPSF